MNGTEFSGVASESLELVRSDTGWQIDDCPDESASCRTVVWFEPFADTEVDSEVCSPEGGDPVLLCFTGVSGEFALEGATEDTITRYFKVYGLDGSQPPSVVEVAGP
jgi:hypothetical protein